METYIAEPRHSREDLSPRLIKVSLIKTLTVARKSMNEVVLCSNSNVIFHASRCGPVQTAEVQKWSRR